MSTTEHEIATVEELSNDGDYVIEEVKGQEIAVFRIEGEYYAVANYCIHQGGPVCEGGELTGHLDVAENDWDWTYEKEGKIISCPWHAWKFDVTSGKNIADERYSVPTYDVIVRDDTVFVKR
jgi:nitrite reductase/ring-hydroxylating ferredoxin subunit